MCNVGIGVTTPMKINVNGNVSLAEPCSCAPLHITNNSTEVIRVNAVYQTLDLDTKRNLLQKVKDWIASEEARLKTAEENRPVHNNRIVP